jgi:hypothetical protein
MKLGFLSFDEQTFDTIFFIKDIMNEECAGLFCFNKCIFFFGIRFGKVRKFVELA